MRTSVYTISRFIILKTSEYYIRVLHLKVLELDL